MGRNVSSGSLVRAQSDFFLPVGSVNRVVGVQPDSLALYAFVNNAPLPWAVADGTTVQDSSISAGTVYFNEVSGVPGFYSVRFFPDRTGFWRLILKSVSLNAEVVLEFDVSAPAAPAGGLNATFVK
jgi:hypothetical protein